MKFRLKEFRTRMGLTQDEMSARLGISIGLYNGLETGKRRMNADYIEAAAEIFGIRPADLIDDPSNRQAGDVRPILLADVVARIDQRIRDLNTTDRAISVRAGMSPDGIRNWRRRADADPGAGANVQSLVKIAHELGVSMAWLTTGTENAGGGFSEQAEPWQAPPATVDAVARLFAQAARNPAATHRATVDLPAFGVQAGDLLVCDLSRLPGSGDLSVLTVSNPDTDDSRTIVRRFVPPFLLSGLAQMQGNPESADDPNLTPRHPIVGIIRGA